MKITLHKGNRIFKAYVTSLGGNLVKVSYYEIIRPHWKIFQTTFFPFYSCTFWLGDYDTIMTGVSTCLAHGTMRYSKEQERIKKWKEFDETVKRRKKC